MTHYTWDHSNIVNYLPGMQMHPLVFMFYRKPLLSYVNRQDSKAILRTILYVQPQDCTMLELMNNLLLKKLGIGQRQSVPKKEPKMLSLWKSVKSKWKNDMWIRRYWLGKLLKKSSDVERFLYVPLNQENFIKSIVICHSLSLNLSLLHH